MSGYEHVGVIKLDDYALEEAKWAACNTPFSKEEPAESMEHHARVAENAIKIYLETLLMEPR